MNKKILNSNDAYNLLGELDAPQKLIRHVDLVLETAEEVFEEMLKLTNSVDYEFVRIGIVLHDIGKIKAVIDFIGSDISHEKVGERYLLALGVDEKIARCCVSHANFEEMECSIEEYIIALADNIWKGKRVEFLESKICNWLNQLFDDKSWELEVKWDEIFETISKKGLERLIRS